jgi:hypothetical protein
MDLIDFVRGKQPRYRNRAYVEQITESHLRFRRHAVDLIDENTTRLPKDVADHPLLDFRSSSLLDEVNRS